MSTETESWMAQVRGEMDRLDTVIYELIRQRAAAARRLGQLHVETGRPRIRHGDELKVIGKYAGELGDDGARVALALLHLG